MSKKTKILIATGNKGKAKEMLEVLSSLPCEFVTLADLNFENDAEEDGVTHEENALKKAYHFYKKTGLPTIGEDSGISVEALKNELGIHTRRWGAGENASDEEWLDYFLKRLESEQNRNAKFTCVAGFVYKDTEELFKGETKGYLEKEPKCELPHGIPISALFVPDGEEKVYANLSVNEKNKISHRGKAMHQLKDYINEFLK